jgi:hypothetical protein
VRSPRRWRRTAARRATSAIGEELADAIIRILDTAKAMGLNIGGAV